VIRSFRHKGLEAFFRTGSKAGILPRHAARLRLILTTLDNASVPQDMNLAGFYLHRLSGQLSGCWSVRVDGNWRVVFRFHERSAELLDYLDYH
jgi:proteic killer suppression protein